jgi:hypothetical protein
VGLAQFVLLVSGYTFAGLPHQEEDGGGGGDSPSLARNVSR